jgi:hypothetical protein
VQLCQRWIGQNELAAVVTVEFPRKARERSLAGRGLSTATSPCRTSTSTFPAARRRTEKDVPRARTAFPPAPAHRPLHLRKCIEQIRPHRPIEGPQALEALRLAPAFLHAHECGVVPRVLAQPLLPGSQGHLRGVDVQPHEPCSGRFIGVECIRSTVQYGDSRKVRCAHPNGRPTLEFPLRGSV